MNVFTYGSLMFPEVWSRVTGLTRSGRPARLTGYAARRLKGHVYPVLVPSPASSTDGILYQGVPHAAVALLDDFEGDFYQRVLLDIMTAGETAALSAWTYLASDPEAAGILIDAWSAEEFERDHLQIFLGHDPGFTGEGRSALDATGQAT